MAEELKFEIIDPGTPSEEPKFEIIDPGTPGAKPEGEYDPEEYEGVAQEFFEGVASGGTKIVQGVVELGALLSDATRGTDYHDDVVESFESFRAGLGIDPKGISGAIGEVGTQFVVPGVAAARVVGGLNALAKTGRLGKTAAQLGAAGVADAVVATNDTMTIGDFFDAGPTKTGDLVGLEAEERAIQGLADKLKVGVEGAAGVVVAPFALRVVGEVAGKGATAVGQIPGATQLASVAKATGKKIGRPLAQIEEARRMGETQSPFKNGIADALATLRYRGILPQEVADSRSLIPGLTEAEVRVANKLTTQLDQEIDKVVKIAAKNTEDSTALAKSDVFNTIDKYLTDPVRAEKAKFLKSLPKALRQPVSKMRTHLDQLSQRIVDSDFIKANDFYVKETKKTISETIKGNLGSYLARRYRALEDPAYKPSDAVLREAASKFREDPVAVQTELQKIAESRKKTTAELGLSDDFKLLGQVTEEQARIARDNFLETWKKRAVSKPVKGVSRVAEQRLKTGQFITRQNIKDYQRALVGEVKNPLENYVATVSNMAEFNAVDNYFANIRRIAEQTPNGIGKIFRKPPEGGFSKTARDTLNDEGYVVLGSGKGSSRADKSVEETLDTSGWGSLHGFAVPERVYQDLTRTVVGDTGWIGNSLRATYSGFLRTKGLAQYGKTILSPVTQIRNVTTASAFAAAQGNIGKGANLYESVRLVFENLRRLPKEKLAQEYADLQRLGIVNSQAELRELQELVRKGFGFADDVDGAVTKGFGSKLSELPVIRWSKKAEALYQGGDDIWKVYNFVFEQNKLRNALSNMSAGDRATYVARKGGNIDELDKFIKEEAASIVRNNVPNYNLAPEAIKSLRRAPVGNFIAFPYEIIRTGINTIARGIDELADANVEIQKIGLRRLTGAATTFAVFPIGLSALGYAISGVSREEMKSYQRSLAAPWEKNARLIPTGRHEDGTPRYVNFSYSNPYDMLERTAISALNAFQRGELEGRSTARLVSDAAFASLGELISPFTEESMALAAFRDVLDPEAENPVMRTLGQIGRGGKTITGAKIYNPEDSVGDKLAKSFNHIADTLLPSIVPLDESGGRLEPSRFARGFINDLDLNDALGIKEEDRMGRVRDLSQELARAFTGVTESDSQASQGLKYKGYEFAKARQDASNIFNSLARRPNVTKEQLLEAYKDANEARFRAYNRFYNTLKDIEGLGLDTSEVMRILKEANISGVDALSIGVYEPFEVSKSVLDNMARNGTLDEVPWNEISDLMSESMDRSFFRDEEPTVERETQQPRFEIIDPGTPSQQPRFEIIDPGTSSEMIAPSAQPTISTAQVKPTTPKQVQEKQRTVLGTASNPATALADLLISQGSTG